MKPPRDPPRLLDPGSDAPEWLRSSLDAGLRDVPRPERLARIAARLPMGPGGPLPPSAPAAPAAPVPSLFSGAAAGAAIGLALVGAGWLASSRASAPAPAARATPVAALSIVAPIAAPPPPETSAPALRPRPLPATPRSASTASAPAVAPAAPEPSLAANPGPEPAPTAAEPDLQVAEPEGDILKRAQDALIAGNPAQALALTDLHLARYPGGQLGQEREVLAVSSLLKLGRAAEARARAERFLAAFPTSGHARRLEVLIPDLGSHKEPSNHPSTP